MPNLARSGVVVNEAQDLPIQILNVGEAERSCSRRTRSSPVSARRWHRGWNSWNRNFGTVFRRPFVDHGSAFHRAPRAPWALLRRPRADDPLAGGLRDHGWGSITSHACFKKRSLCGTPRHDLLKGGVISLCLKSTHCVFDLRFLCSNWAILICRHFLTREQRKKKIFYLQKELG